MPPVVWVKFRDCIIGGETHDKNEFEIVHESPFDRVAVFLVLVIGSSALNEGFPNQRIDRGSRRGSSL